MFISIREKLNTLYSHHFDVRQTWKPLFYRIDNLKDRKDFSELLNTPGIIVVDTIFDQIKEFVKISHPTERLTDKKLEDLAQKHIFPCSIEEYGVWVYYPWSNRLVHIVDEQEFIELRTSRNQYKITKEEREQLAQKKIGIVGLSVGQSVAATLAMERIAGEIRLADFDVLELTNLNRIRTGIHNLGLPKVYSVAREIAEIDPFIHVSCFPQGITEDNMIHFLTDNGKLDLILEESDGFDIKIMIRHKARELRIPVVMESSDKCMVDVERFDLEPSRNILHGLIEQLDIATLKALKTNEEKIPYMLDILGIETLSPRLKASMLEIGKTITTWPQLGSAVTMGGGIAADVSRRLLLNQFTSSGRYYVDVENIINDKPNHLRPSDKQEIISREEMTRLIRELPSSTTIRSIDKTVLDELIETSIKTASVISPIEWNWLTEDHALYLFKKDSNHDFFSTDPTTILLALGGLVENIANAAQSLLLSPIISTYPLLNDQRLLAKITFETLHEVPEEEETQLTDLIKIKNVTEQLEGISLNLFEDDTPVEKINRILTACERIYMLHASMHQQVMRHTKDFSEIIQKQLALPHLSADKHMKLLVSSDPDVASLLAEWEKGQILEEFSSLVALPTGFISVNTTHPLSIVHAGRALQRAFQYAAKHQFDLQSIPVFSFLHSSIHYPNILPLSKTLSMQLKKNAQNLALLHPDLTRKESVILFRLTPVKSFSKSNP